MGNKHFTLTERRQLEKLLDGQASLRACGEQLEKSSSTISREIRKHRVPSDKGAYGRIRNLCIHRSTCDRHSLCEDEPDCMRKCRSCKKCNSLCPDFQEEYCSKLNMSPYVCNGCQDRTSCVLRKFFYNASQADRQYHTLLTESRSGFNLSEAERLYLDNVCSPLLKQGQSIYHVLNTHRNEITVAPRTMYRLVNGCAISARNIDMPRVCRMKPRKGKTDSAKIDRKCRIGRKLADFASFMEAYPDISIAEIDTVEGSVGGKVLLTIHLKALDFMLAFLRDHNTAASVGEIFSRLRSILPTEVYHALFFVLLTDNGSEFTAPSLIETDDRGNTVSRLFYCDPQAPFQKPNVELNHEFIRRCLPKGSSFDNLTQAQVSRMMSHINSYGRAKFSGKSPTQLFISTFGEEALHLLGQELTPPESIILTPKVLML